MTSMLLAPIVALGLVFQSSPPSGAAGSSGRAGAGGTQTGSGTSGATVKKGGHDLADILLPLVDRGVGSRDLAPPSPPTGTNVRVSSSSSGAQVAPVIAIDPTDRLHLIGAALDRGHGAYYASFDGGGTWSQFTETHDDTHDDTLEIGTAASATFGPAGESWLCRGIHYDYYGVRGDYLQIGLSPDGGVTEPTWSLPIAKKHPSLAVDSASGPFAGRVFVAASVDDIQESDHLYYILLSSTDDGGQTWTDVVVSDGTDTSVDWPSVAVGSSGAVHVVWHDPVLQQIESDVSLDGAATFGTDVEVAGAKGYHVPGVAPSFRPSPRLAVDTSGGPFQDTLYVVWTSDGGADGPDVVFSKSTDQGATWSDPVVASDVTTHSQFAPCIAVDPNGNVVIGFYDCRDDPNNRRVSFYVSRSSDGGATFQPNVKVSDADFDVSTITGWERVVAANGIATSDRMVHAIWTDGRNGDPDVYAGAAALDFSSDLASISASTGGTVTFTLSPGPLFGSTEYHVLGSLSGTTPGTDFFFENVPINYDLFTLATIYDANSNVFPGFTGALDASGAAAAQLVSGPLPPALIGVQMDFAALVRVNGAVRWGSAPTSVVIGN
ncbi:MAG TPA: sialidase family protein [Planctomycetota bacterium]|jgi:hypothetical protein|nr:sialidase family protein [Planctomycetota bacterium]